MSDAAKKPEKKPAHTQDGSNAWAAGNDGDIPGVWEGKEALSYPVIDRFGQHFIVWHFPKAGMIIRPHQHKYEHDSILLSGSVRVMGDAEREDGSVMVAPDTLFFKAGELHSIKSVTDNVVMIHSYPPGFTPDDGL